MVLLIEHWHYTTFVDALDRWQALVAGGLGFLAAIIVVYVTLRIERRKAERELDALRKSLAVELRQLVPRALGAAVALKKLAREKNPITARMVENYARIPTAIIYPANADKIGLLGNDAISVVVFYSLIELAKAATDSLMGSREPDNISPATVEATAGTFFTACAYSAEKVLPNFKTGVASHEQKDAALIQSIETSRAAFQPDTTRAAEIAAPRNSR